MESADADYHSFLVRIWREGQTKTGDAGDEWLFQMEDFTSGDTLYFHHIGELADYVDVGLKMEADSPCPEN